MFGVNLSEFVRAMAFKLPFDDCLMAPLDVHILTKQRLLDWIKSESVSRILLDWKKTVIDHERLCDQIEDTFAQHSKYLHDTIYTLVTLSLAEQKNTTNDKEQVKDAFWLTILTINALVISDGINHIFPPQGNTDLQVLTELATRLLLTIFKDRRNGQRGYFANLLGGRELNPRILNKLGRQDAAGIGLGEFYFSPDPTENMKETSKKERARKATAQKARARKAANVFKRKAPKFETVVSIDSDEDEDMDEDSESQGASPNSTQSPIPNNLESLDACGQLHGPKQKAGHGKDKTTLYNQWRNPR